MKKINALFILALASFTFLNAQVDTIFKENFGTGTGYFMNAAGNFTGYSETGTTFPVEDSIFIRNNTPSDTYTPASGGNYALFTPSNFGGLFDTVTFMRINTQGYQNIAIHFGIYWGTGWGGIRDHNFGMDISADDGSSWTQFVSPIATVAPDTFPSNNTWQWVTVDYTVPGDTNLWVRFYNTGSDHQFQLDDITLTGEPIAVTGVDVSRDSIEVVMGADSMINATIQPTDALNDTIAWTSRNESIATIAEGTITGVAEGITYVVAESKDGGFMDSCKVKVIPVPVSGVSLDHDSIDLAVDADSVINATVEPANAGDQTVSWLSRNESVATVSGGTITGVAEGMTYIVVETTDGGFTDSCKVNIIKGTSVNDVASSEVAVYPIPASDVVTVTGNVLSVEIVDLTGKVVKAITKDSNTTVISVANLSAGVYIIKIDNGSAIITKKLIIE